MTHPRSWYQTGGCHSVPGTRAILPATQQMLAMYLQVLVEQRQLEKRVQDLRGELMRALDARAGIEPGPLTARMSETSARVFSFERLVPVVGRQTAERLRDQIAPIIRRRLVVQPRAESGDVSEALWHSAGVAGRPSPFRIAWTRRAS